MAEESSTFCSLQPRHLHWVVMPRTELIQVADLFQPQPEHQQTFHGEVILVHREEDLAALTHSDQLPQHQSDRTQGPCREAFAFAIPNLSLPAFRERLSSDTDASLFGKQPSLVYQENHKETSLVLDDCRSKFVTHHPSANSLSPRPH